MEIKIKDHDAEALAALDAQEKSARALITTTIPERRKLVTAHQTGRKIEMREIKNPDRWYHCAVPMWLWDDYEYRIAVEPKVFYRIYGAGRDSYAAQFNTEQQVMDYLRTCSCSPMWSGKYRESSETELEYQLRRTGFRLEKYQQVMA